MSQTTHGASCVLKQLFTVSHPAGQIQMTRLRVCVLCVSVCVWEASGSWAQLVNVSLVSPPYVCIERARPTQKGERMHAA